MTLKMLYSYFKEGCKLHPLINTFAVISDESSIANDNVEFNIYDRDKVYYLNKKLLPKQSTKEVRSDPPYVYLRRESSSIKNLSAKNYLIDQNFEVLCLMDDHIISANEKVKNSKHYHRQEIFEITQRLLVELFSYLAHANTRIQTSLINGIQMVDFVDSGTKLTGTLCTLHFKIDCVNFNHMYWNTPNYWIDGDGTLIDDGTGGNIIIN